MGKLEKVFIDFRLRINKQFRTFTVTMYDEKGKKIKFKTLPQDKETFENMLKFELANWIAFFEKGILVSC